jgi:hypothetical protein
MASMETALRRFGQDDSTLLVEDDRRDGSRVKILKQVRISHLDGAPHDEMATVIDLTREGLYLTTRSPQLNVGTELRLVFPDTCSECTCLVVRVEQLPDGRQGIGVRILDW